MADVPMGVHWREGLFLRPHHMQQAALHFRGALAGRVDSSLPHRWGVVALKVDPLRLEEGVFQVSSMEVVFPSGELARVAAEGGSNAVIQAREIPQRREPRMRIYAGLRRLRDQEPNVSDPPTAEDEEAGEGADAPRYLRVSGPVHDLNTGRNRVDLEFERLNVRLFFEGDRMEGFETVPLAEIVPPAVGLPLRRPSKTYVPPCLRVDASEVVLQALREVYMEAANKAQELSGAMDAADLMAGKVTEAEFLQLWKLFTLRGALPLLREATDGGHVHPYDAYMALLVLQGQFAALTPGTRAPDFPRYDHLQAGTCYEAVCGSILEMLRGDEGPANFKRIDLKRGQLPVGGAAAAAQGIPREWLDGRNAFYLVLANPESGGARDWYRSGHMKAGALSRVGAIVTTKVFGVGLVPCEKPRPLPGRSGAIYFRMETTTAQRPEMRAEWETVVRERSLAVHFATDALGTPGYDPDFEAYVVFGR